MKLIASLKSISMYGAIASKVDGIVLGCQYSFYANNKFNVEEIIALYGKCLEDKKDLFLLVNIVMHQEYVNKVKEFISNFMDLNIHFIYQDLGVYQILKELGIQEKGIYNPLTMITNYNDLMVYDALGVDAVGVSNEITLDDVEICSKHSSKVFYLGFGFHPMYQTYRHLASLYKKYSGLDYSFDSMLIKEANKDPLDPLIENEYGCVVFRSGVISILEEIEKVKDVKYLFIDGILLEQDTQQKVVDIYSKVINNQITKQEGLALMDELNLSYCNKFMDEDSVYNPKDFE